MEGLFSYYSMNPMHIILIHTVLQLLPTVKRAFNQVPALTYIGHGYRFRKETDRECFS